MKILKLLNKILLFKILFSFLLFTNLFSNEPVDIWSINNNSNNENSIEQNNLEESDSDSLIIQTLNNQSTTSIELDNKINVDEKNYLVGLFDPAEHDLTLNMWQLSDGEKILNIIEKLNKLNLSNDAKDLLQHKMLVYSHKNRQTARGCLAHPWFKNAPTTKIDDKIIFLEEIQKKIF